MKGILVVVVLLSILSLSVHAQTNPCAVAPYEVSVTYTPLQPQPAEYTYCTCLPYGCPDGSPIVPQVCGGVECQTCDASTSANAPCGSCGGAQGVLSNVFGVGSCVVGTTSGGVLSTARDLTCDAGRLVSNAVKNVTCVVGSTIACFGGSQRCQAIAQ